jgi:hypothetical protein
MDSTIPRKRLADILLAIAEMEKKYGLRCANVFHAGDGNLHPLILFDANDPDQLHRCELFGADILETSVAMGGTVTGEHGVGVEKLNSITVPEINIRDLPFNRAIDQLIIVSQSYDKDSKGVNMVVIDPDRKNPSVNITLRNVQLGKALDIITKQVNFTYNINQGIIEIRPDSGSNDMETEFFTLSTSALI